MRKRDVGRLATINWPTLQSRDVLSMVVFLTACQRLITSRRGQRKKCSVPLFFLHVSQWQDAGSKECQVGSSKTLCLGFWQKIPHVAGLVSVTISPRLYFRPSRTFYSTVQSLLSLNSGLKQKRIKICNHHETPKVGRGDKVWIVEPVYVTWGMGQRLENYTCTIFTFSFEPLRGRA